MHDLFNTTAKPGRLEWIGLRTGHRRVVTTVPEVEAKAGLGLLGDHRTLGKTPNPQAKRQVTLIQAEHLPVVASLTGQEEVDPTRTRRNLLVSGINLLALKDRRFSIGPVEFEGTGECHPCSRMEETLGAGGFNAMRGHGGITARVLTDGVITVGDPVDLIVTEQAE